MPLGPVCTGRDVDGGLARLENADQEGRLADLLLAGSRLNSGIECARCVREESTRDQTYLVGLGCRQAHDGLPFSTYAKGPVKSTGGGNNVANGGED